MDADTTSADKDEVRRIAPPAIRPPTTKSASAVKPRARKKETFTWDITEGQLSPAAQLQCLRRWRQAETEEEDQTQEGEHTQQFEAQIRRHLRDKLSGYRQQDLAKHRFRPEAFATLDFVRDLLLSAEGRCHYCSRPVHLLYPHVMEQTQWTLDRVDNAQGHNRDNVVVACLACNLRRRCTHKEAFRFAKQVKVVKLCS